MAGELTVDPDRESSNVELFEALDAALQPFVERVRRKCDDRGNWKSEPTPEDELFHDLFYFYNAVQCDGCLFDYMEFMIEHRGQLQAVGAHGYLAALDALMPFYIQWQQLGTEEQRADHWRRTRPDRQAAEELADHSLKFGQLLLDYAKKNADRIG